MRPQREMHEPEIPGDVRSLLRDRVGSYEELEVLLLIAGEPAEPVTAESVGERAWMPGPAAAGALGRLCAAGLAAADPDGATFRFRPLPELARAVELLEREARDNPLAIVKVMSVNAIERIRMSALHMFADAFVLGKDAHRRKGDAHDG